MTMYIELTREEVQEKIAYALICETMGGARWDTGTRRRKWKEFFTESEQKECEKLYKTANQWYLVKGVPDVVKMTSDTLRMWQKLEEFCAAL